MNVRTRFVILAAVAAVVVTWLDCSMHRPTSVTQPEAPTQILDAAPPDTILYLPFDRWASDTAAYVDSMEAR